LFVVTGWGLPFLTASAVAAADGSLCAVSAVATAGVLFCAPSTLVLQMNQMVLFEL
jgi:hypothetical protein